MPFDGTPGIRPIHLLSFPTKFFCSQRIADRTGAVILPFSLDQIRPIWSRTVENLSRSAVAAPFILSKAHLVRPHSHLARPAMYPKEGLMPLFHSHIATRCTPWNPRRMNANDAFSRPHSHEPSRAMPWNAGAIPLRHSHRATDAATRQIRPIRLK